MTTISEEAQKDFFQVSDETFLQDLRGYLQQRLEDERERAKKLEADLNAEKAEDEPTHVVKARAVVIRFTFAVNEARLEVLDVGSDFGLCKEVKTGKMEKINFLQIVRWRDVSDEENV